jgi:hypothetical protein
LLAKIEKKKQLINLIIDKILFLMSDYSVNLCVTIKQKITQRATENA